MSLLSSLLGQANEKVPDNVGKAYDETLKTGSWVVSGIADYKRWTENNFALIKNQFNRYFDFKRDPAKALWLADMLLREDPVKVPKYMSSDEWGFIKKVFNSLIGNKQHLSEEPYYNEEAFETPIELPKNNDESTPAISQDKFYASDATDKDIVNLDAQYGEDEFDLDSLYYTDMTSVYSESKSVTNPKDAIRYAIENLGATIGYKPWYGFELGSNNHWDIQLYPYNGPGSPLSNTPSDFTFTPELPKYKLPKLIDPTLDQYGGNWSEFSFGSRCPALTYNVQFGNQSTKDIKLFNSSAIQIPTGFQYQIMLGLDVADDVHGSFSKYMNKYLNCIYSLSDASLARYDQAATVIKLVVFKPGLKVKWEFEFIGVPYNYTPQLEGSENADVSSVHVEYSIVGLKKPTKSQSIHGSSFIPINESPNWNDTSWTDVIISPNNLK